MTRLRSIAAAGVIATIVASTTACNSTDAAPTKGQSAPSSAATASPQPSPSFKSSCASDPAGTTYASPTAITPRVNGVFVGHEDGKYLVILRYYPNHTAYLAVGMDNTPISTARSWVAPSKNSDAGPFPYDSSGAFTKPVPAGDIFYSVWKYTGDSLNLHAVSHHECREHTMLMTFIPD